jgi:hypothetical protein
MWDKNIEETLSGWAHTSDPIGNIQEFVLDSIKEIHILQIYSAQLLWDESRIWRCEKCGRESVGAFIGDNLSDVRVDFPVFGRKRAARPLTFILKEQLGIKNVQVESLISELGKHIGSEKARKLANKFGGIK